LNTILEQGGYTHDNERITEQTVATAICLRDTISSLAETAAMSPKSQKIDHLLSDRKWSIFCVVEYVLLFHHHFHHIFKLTCCRLMLDPFLITVI
jgi:hypothetical protein